MTGSERQGGPALAWAVGAAVLLWIALGALLVASPSAAHDVVLVGALEAAVLLALVTLVLRWHAPQASLRVAAGLRPTHPLLAVLGVPLGVLLQIPAAGIRGLVDSIAPPPTVALAHRALLYEIDGPVRLVATVAVIACAVPLAEELWARGVVYGLVARGAGPVRGALASIAAFVALHLLDWRELPVLVLSGGLLAFLRATSGSLVPGLALHVAFNAAALVALVTGGASATRSLHPSSLVTLGGWLGLLVMVAVTGWLAARSDDARIAREEDLA